MSLNLLTQEEMDNKTEMISVTEEVLDAQGIECEAKIAIASAHEDSFMPQPFRVHCPTAV